MTSSRPRLVIVGASLAGLRAAEAARENGHDGAIVLIGAEEHLPYELDVRSARMLILGALNWAAEWWNPRRGSLDTVVRTAQSMVRHGLCEPDVLDAGSKPTAPAHRSRAKRTVARAVETRDS